MVQPNIRSPGSPPTRYRIFPLAIFLVSLSACVSATARTYYTAPNGSDSNAGTSAAPFKTIQEAVGVVRAGDTVLIHAGRYAPFYLKNINGTAGAPITFKGEPGAIIDRNLSDASRNIEFYGSSYIIIDGLELTDSDLVPPGRTCKDNDSYKNGIKFNKGSSGTDTHHVVIKNMSIHDLRGQGILGSSDYLQVLNNHIYDNGGRRKGWVNQAYGVYLKGKGLLIRGNIIHGNNGNGIRTGNDPRNSGVEGLLVDSIIENNLIYDNHGEILHQSGPTGCRIITGGDGIVVWHGSGNIIRNNIVYNNGRGIRIDEDTTLNNTPNVVYNNTVYKNEQEGLYTYEGQKTIFKNNISYLNSGQDIFASASSVLSNNLTTDPKFVSPDSGDFGLQTSSPAIDKGVTLAEVPTDFTGKQRPEGAAYDIGVFEGAGSRANVLPPTSGGSVPSGAPVFYSPDGKVCPSGYN